MRDEAEGEDLGEGASEHVSKSDFHTALCWGCGRSMRGTRDWEVNTHHEMRE